jgi:N-hydroxyarylamine O-acetyltransferase
VNQLPPQAPQSILRDTAFQAAYLDRIGYKGFTQPNAECLQSIHRAHLFAVPFENLDIPLGRRIVCEEEAFLHKIVERRRGGFCYEMNGAFAALLRALGFKATLLSARVPREDGSDGPEFDHLALRVDLGQPWMADVGFGDSFLDPLRLEIGTEQLQPAGKFRIVEKKGSFHIERIATDGAWQQQYSFTLQPRQLEEFAPMCHYHQTSPESPFTRKSLCTKATPAGRITLSDRKLLVTRHGRKEARVLGSDEEWYVMLKKHFGIVL